MAKLPEVGAVYAMPAGKRLEGLCRVIAKRGKSLLVAASPWLGKKATAATLAEPAARAILKLTHHSWGGSEELLWDEAPPKSFRHVGTLTPTADERKRTCDNTFSPKARAIEHSICSRENRTVLSMLWIPDAVAARVGMA